MQALTKLLKHSLPSLPAAVQTVRDHVFSLLQNISGVNVSTVQACFKFIGVVLQKCPADVITLTAAQTSVLLGFIVQDMEVSDKQAAALELLLVACVSAPLNDSSAHLFHIVHRRASFDVSSTVRYHQTCW